MWFGKETEGGVWVSQDLLLSYQGPALRQAEPKHKVSTAFTSDRTYSTWKKVNTYKWAIHVTDRGIWKSLFVGLKHDWQASTALPSTSEAHFLSSDEKHIKSINANATSLLSWQSAVKIGIHKHHLQAWPFHNSVMSWLFTSMLWSSQCGFQLSVEGEVMAGAC